MQYVMPVLKSIVKYCRRAPARVGATAAGQLPDSHAAEAPRAAGVLREGGHAAQESPGLCSSAGYRGAGPTLFNAAHAGPGG